jgi:hypothetical protein
VLVEWEEIVGNDHLVDAVVAVVFIDGSEMNCKTMQCESFPDTQAIPYFYPVI